MTSAIVTYVSAGQFTYIKQLRIFTGIEKFHFCATNIGTRVNIKEKNEERIQK